MLIKFLIIILILIAVAFFTITKRKLIMAPKQRPIGSAEARYEPSFSPKGLCSKELGTTYSTFFIPVLFKTPQQEHEESMQLVWSMITGYGETIDNKLRAQEKEQFLLTERIRDKIYRADNSYYIYKDEDLNLARTFMHRSRISERVTTDGIVHKTCTRVSEHITCRDVEVNSALRSGFRILPKQERKYTHGEADFYFSRVDSIDLLKKTKGKHDYIVNDKYQDVANMDLVQLAVDDDSLLDTISKNPEKNVLWRTHSTKTGDTFYIETDSARIGKHNLHSHIIKGGEKDSLLDQWVVKRHSLEYTSVQGTNEEPATLTEARAYITDFLWARKLSYNEYFGLTDNKYWFKPLPRVGTVIDDFDFINFILKYDAGMFIISCFIFCWLLSVIGRNISTTLSEQQAAIEDMGLVGISMTTHRLQEDSYSAGNMFSVCTFLFLLYGTPYLDDFIEKVSQQGALHSDDLRELFFTNGSQMEYDYFLPDNCFVWDHVPCQGAAELIAHVMGYKFEVPDVTKEPYTHLMGLEYKIHKGEQSVHFERPDAPGEFGGFCYKDGEVYSIPLIRREYTVGEVKYIPEMPNLVMTERSTSNKIIEDFYNSVADCRFKYPLVALREWALTTLPSFENVFRIIWLAGAIWFILTIVFIIRRVIRRTNFEARSDLFLLVKDPIKFFAFFSSSPAVRLVRNVLISVFVVLVSFWYFGYNLIEYLPEFCKLYRGVFWESVSLPTLEGGFGNETTLEIKKALQKSKIHEDGAAYVYEHFLWVRAVMSFFILFAQGAVLWCFTLVLFFYVSYLVYEFYTEKFSTSTVRVFKHKHVQDFIEREDTSYYSEAEKTEFKFEYAFNMFYEGVGILELLDNFFAEFDDKYSRYMYKYLMREVVAKTAALDSEIYDNYWADWQDRQDLYFNCGGEIYDSVLDVFEKDIKEAEEEERTNLYTFKTNNQVIEELCFWSPYLYTRGRELFSNIDDIDMLQIKYDAYEEDDGPEEYELEEAAAEAGVVYVPEDDVTHVSSEDEWDKDEELPVGDPNLGEPLVDMVMDEWARGDELEDDNTFYSDAAPNIGINMPAPYFDSDLDEEDDRLEF